MKLYRLKEAAYPFFKQGLQTAILEYDVWTQTYNVCPEAIEEVKPCYVSCGIMEGRQKSISGWNQKDGSQFLFTLHFPSMKCREYDNFSKGTLSRQLVDTIQNAVDNWWNKLNTEEEQHN